MQLPRTLVGLAFSIPELTLLENLASASSLRMEIRVDHGSDTEEFEEYWRSMSATDRRAAGSSGACDSNLCTTADRPRPTLQVDC